MQTNKEAIILEELDRYKWPKQFICLKCGNTTYISGEEQFSRRCSNGKCKRDVSLKKYTAFEGLRFPIEKAYGILEKLIDGAIFDLDKKLIAIKKRKKKEEISDDLFDASADHEEDFDFISGMELIEHSKKNNWAPGRIDERLWQHRNRYRPSIASLSQDFSIEENTVKKFLHKINDRLRPEYKTEVDEPLERLLSYIESHEKECTLLYLIGMAMVPTIGEWQHGVIRIDNRNYGINPVFKDGPWSVFRATVILTKDNYSYEFHEEYRYGSQDWYNLFHVNIDK